MLLPQYMQPRSLIRNLVMKMTQNSFHKARFVFLLATMRSRSTMLSHILNSNNQILSIGESYANFHSKEDINKLFVRILFGNKTLQFQSKMLLEKTTMNEKSPDIALIDEYIDQLIILVRNPESSIKSLMFNTARQNIPYSEDQAIGYFKNRYEYLNRVLMNVDSEKYVLIESDDLVNNTEFELNRVSEFLKLKTKLSPTYKIKKSASKLGDSSKKIYLREISDEHSNHNYQIKTNISELTEMYLELKSKYSRLP